MLGKGDSSILRRNSLAGYGHTYRILPDLFLTILLRFNRIVTYVVNLWCIIQFINGPPKNTCMLYG